MLTIPTDGIQTSWLFTKRGLGFGRGLGYRETNPGDQSGPADYKSGALTTRPRRIPLNHIHLLLWNVPNRYFLETLASTEKLFGHVKIFESHP